MKTGRKPRATSLRIKPICQAVLAAAMTVGSVSQVYGIVISEDFTQPNTTQKWLRPTPGGGRWAVHAPLAGGTPNTDNTACLTATGSSPGSNSLPHCSGTSDAPGKGALRLTPARQQKVGGIVSDFSFPTNDGVDITFTTYTWGGNGADGMTFFLSDADRPPTLGASGGSIGYSCSQTNPIFSGVDGGYMAIGIDEWGNFVNKGDNTNSGLGWIPNTIGIRGKGSLNFDYFANPNRFLAEYWKKRGWGSVSPSAERSWKQAWQDNDAGYDMLRNVCKNGELTLKREWTGNNTAVKLSSALPETDPNHLSNYKYITHKTLRFPLDTKGVRSRDQAIPMLYRIRITKDGKANVWYSRNAGTYQPVLLDYDVVKNNGTLPAQFRFGFMGATGGAYNNHEVTCFKAAPATLSDGNAEVNTPDSKIVSESQVYLTFYNSFNWTGSVVAQNIVKTPDGKYHVDSKVNWDAGCGLTGGKCERRENRTFTAQQGRKLFTSSNNSGVNLTWENLSAQQQSSLKGSGDDTLGQQRLAYLKGDRSQEAVNVGVGLFRPRKSVLGDIINSSPVWVGYPATQNYLKGEWKDARNPAAAMPERTGQSYQDYATANARRLNVVYAGSNDGFLHGFAAGSYSAPKQFDNTDNTGKEVFAYMPGAVLSRMHNPGKPALDFFNERYAHNFYNDAAVGTGDVFYNGQWHTWIMGGLGAGGNTVYALDVTKPDTFSEQNVVGEWSFDANDPIWRNLGNTYGTPVFGRFHDGNWGAVFGNGWCSTTDAANGNCTASGGPAGIYVMSIDQASGRPSFRFISTGESGTPNDPNGIAHVTPVDLDGDRIYDYAYAGDLKGNVWRFDLTDTQGSSWATKQPQKIFTTQSGQPISTKIVVSRAEKGNRGDVLLNFGTGLRKVGYTDEATTYATGTQSIYGLRDRQAAAFPNGGGTTAAQINGRTRLQQHRVTDRSKGTLSNDKVNWTNYDGWYMDLETVNLGLDDKGKPNIQYEQVIYNPYLDQGKYFIVNTFINGSSPILTCTETQVTGYTYPFETTTGSVVRGFFDKNTENTTKRSQYNAIGSPQLLRTVDGKIWLLSKDSGGNVRLDEVFLPSELGTYKIRRLSWREIY
ncbi:PilC/PilY family type IV pilus protein [Kingella sp. SNUBH-2017]|uniref:PilC/PilY family type IV pilus protein n=1 Tax=Kingella sp. SNUBH-2017 TaxID=2994077 RepID=UPI0023638B92|nr:PilC/PilY family type IV pilus protein [Kingella sp. SNUBH-2017]MDD2181921.1 PilC/PilY family type IV pilus protein [Kingella sp. SNUBH-2017]